MQNSKIQTFALQFFREITDRLTKLANHLILTRHSHFNSLSKLVVNVFSPPYQNESSPFQKNLRQVLIKVRESINDLVKLQKNYKQRPRPKAKKKSAAISALKQQQFELSFQDPPIIKPVFERLRTEQDSIEMLLDAVNHRMEHILTLRQKQWQEKPMWQKDKQTLRLCQQ